MQIVIANSNISTAFIYKALKEDFEIKYVSTKEELSLARLQEWNPRYIFFPHWSYIIPQEIYEQFECVVFHMTDLPYGRGGSPLQNLIVNGVTATKISALQVDKGIDTGDIYLKNDLSLLGRAEEIYNRAGRVIMSMIYQISELDLKPIKQTGDIVEFKRRKPSESNLSEMDNSEQLFNFIRMLDAPHYPKAFIETKHFMLEFERASLHSDGSVRADVVFKKKQKNE